MFARDLVPQLRSARFPTGGEVVEFPRARLEVSDEAAVRVAIEEAQPDVVIHCAAYTDVDVCETQVDLAMRVNGLAPGYLAAASKRAGALLVHISTDFVFDGRAVTPYLPDGAPNPLSVYGRSKLAGETAILESGCRFLIVRTSWLFGLHGRNFVKAILKKAAAGEPLRVVADQRGRPTYTVDLADGLIRLLAASAQGIFHVANSGECTWHEFAVEIVRAAGHSTPVAAITSAELNRPAQRPAYSVLDLTSYEEATGHRPPDWRDALRRYLAEERLHRA